MIIAVDFDGTVVEHTFPEIGNEVPGAVTTLKDLVDAGHHLILFTMRSGETLEAAVQWFSDRSIPLFGINENPTQYTWTTSPKAYANIYIDDAAACCPVIQPENEASRPYVDWQEIRRALHIRGLFASE